jgi:hypothetical protein
MIFFRTPLIPLRGQRVFAHPLSLKGSTRPSGFRHPMRAGSLQGKEGRGKDVPVPFREKRVLEG